jgi:defect-in-organelle-trafficking protein DotC
MRIKAIFIIATALMLAGCVSPARMPGTNSLQQLQEINFGAISRARAVNINQMRYTSLKDSAMSLGAQSGLAWRAKQVNAVLKKNELQLNHAYNFAQLLLNHNVIPPVLVEANTTLNLSDPNTIRLSEKIYKIQSQARFVTAPPLWRDYLWMNYPTPPVPDNSILPKTKAEQEIWKHYVAVGWQNGIEQANNIFHENLSRLNRDFKGMILYRKLYRENMVSAPFVAKTELGITGNSSEMNIGDRVLRITALPQLNLQANTWKPAVVNNENANEPENHN